MLQLTRPQLLIVLLLVGGMVDCAVRLVNDSSVQVPARALTAGLVWWQLLWCLRPTGGTARAILAGMLLPALCLFASHGARPGQFVAALPWIALIATAGGLLAACDSLFRETSETTALPRTDVARLAPRNGQFPAVLNQHEVPREIELAATAVTGDAADELIRVDRSQFQLSATGIASLRAGERQCWWHLPFSPSFGESPEVWCETDDPTVSVEVDRVWPFGARLKVRRSGELDDPLQVTLEICAHTASAQSSAA